MYLNNKINIVQMQITIKNCLYVMTHNLCYPMKAT